MSCSIKKILAENKKESILYKELENRYGQAEALKIYIGTKLKEYPSYVLDTNGEPSINTIINDLSEGKSFEREIKSKSTGDVTLDKFINKWRNQIKILRREITSNPEQKDVKERHIAELQDNIDKLLDKKNLKTVLDIGEVYRKQVISELAKNPDIKDLYKLQTYISLWGNVGEIIGSVSDEELRGKISVLEGEFKHLDRQWLKQTIEIILDDYNKTRDDAHKVKFEDFVKATKDINWLNAMTLDSSISHSIIEHAFDRYTKDTEFNINHETEKLHAEIDDKILGFNEKYGKDWSKYLLQLTDGETGENTGNLKDKYKQTFYNILKEKSREAHKNSSLWSSFFKWLDNNSYRLTIKEIEDEVSDKFDKEEIDKGKELLERYKIDIENWKQEIEQRLKLEFENKEGKIEDEATYLKELDKRIKALEKEKSPYLYEQYKREVEEGNRPTKDLAGMRGYKYLLYPKPKEEWIDSTYTDLEKNKPELFEFLQYFKKTVKDWLEYLPNQNVQSNTIPEMQRNIIEEYMANGSTAAFNKMGASLLHSITSEDLGDVNRNPINEDTGETINSLRSGMLNNELSASEKSYNLPKILKLFTSMAATYKFKVEVEPKLLLLKAIFDNLDGTVQSQDDVAMKSEEGIIKVKNGLKNMKSRIEYLMDVFYGKPKKDEGVLYTYPEPDSFKNLTNEEKLKLDSEKGKYIQVKDDVVLWKGSKIVASKIADDLIQYTSVKVLGLNPFSISANWFYGHVVNILHAADGVDYTTKEYGFGMKILSESIWNKTYKEKVCRLMELYQIMPESNSNKYGEGTRLFDFAYYGHKIGELHLQGSAMVAMMVHTKIKDNDGNEVSLWDAYSAKGHLKEEFSNTDLAEKDGKAGKKVIDEHHHMQQVISLTNGPTYKNSPRQGKKVILGRMLFMFRNFIPMTVQERFGKQNYDPRLNRDTKGRWLSYGDFTKDAYNEAGGGVIGIANVVKNLGLAITQPLLRTMGSNSNVYSKLSPIDEQNMKKNIRELAIAATFYTTAMMLKAAGDDKNKWLIYWLNSSKRIEADLWFYCSPGAFKQIVQDPVPLIKTVFDFMKIPPDVIHGDMDKLGKDVVNTIPFFNQIPKTINLTHKQIYK